MTSAPNRDADVPMNNSLLGSDYELDHVIFITADLAEASRDFRETLGFATEADSQFPSGVKNESMSFVTRQYLELIAVYDRTTGHPDVAEIEAFLSKGEGAAAFGIRVPSIEATARRLTERGVPFDGPTDKSTTYPGIEEVPPVLWRGVVLKTGRKFVDESMFFTEYVEGAYQGFRSRHPELPDPDASPPHPNTALGGLSVWHASSDVRGTAAAYEAIGFPRVRTVRMDRVEAEGVEFRIGTGRLLVLGSTSSTGPVARFLKGRDADDGLMGVGVGVRSLKSALGAMKRDLASRLEPEDGLFGRSVLVPPEFAHGVWLELVEHRPLGA
jgi:catechol 2,3-dioxygenase-like lactoylglutathione lyase family enzyme